MRYSELLNEALEYALLLENEQRADFLLKTFGSKLGGKFLQQLGQLPYQIAHGITGLDSNGIYDLAAAITDAEKAKEANTPELQKKVVEFIMNADPTQNKAYSRWIVSRYLKSDEKLEDMGEHLSHTLTVFAQAAQARRVNGNIDAYKSFEELTTACEPFLTGERETSSNRDRKAKRDTKVDTRKEKQWEGDPMLEQAKVVHDTDDYMILIPNSAEAAAHFGKNTHWCTTTTMYQHYAKDGPLYIILRRRDAKRWQFHFESDQFMDELDRGVDINAWIDENREAFDALGEEKFTPFIGKRAGYGGTVLSIRHFSPEVIEKANDADLARSVTEARDLDALPKDKVMSKHFFEALLPKMNPDRTRDGLSKEETAKILPRYVKAFGRDEHYFENLLPQHSWLLRMLPEKLQTDAAKETVANHLYQYQEMSRAIPQPWNDVVDARYWLTRCEQDRYLRPALTDEAAPPKSTDTGDAEQDLRNWSDNAANDKLPRRYQSDENLVRLLAHFPQDIDHFHSRLSPEFCQRLLDLTISNPVTCGNMLDHLPERCLTKKLQLPIYKYAQQFTTKATADQRDGYLACLARFHNDHWPWKSSKISDRMSIVNPRFEANPKQFHTMDQALRWVNYHPEKLSTLPADVVNEIVVEAALLSDNRSPRNKTDTGNFLDDVLDACDPEIVKPEWVAAAIKKLSSNKGGLKEFWRGIPKKYLTRENIDALLAGGNIALDDPEFPKDGYTGSNVLARFNLAVDPTFLHRVTKEEAEEEAKKQGKERASGWGQTEERLNREELEQAWALVPDAHKKEALIALFSMKPKAGSSSYSRYGERQLSPKDWHCMSEIVDKKYLDSDTLDAFLSSCAKYGGGDKKFFKQFPKSAYTPANMARAVDYGIIDKVPDDLADDNVITSMLINDAKKLDMKKVTPEIMIAAVRKDGWNVGHRMVFLDDKQAKDITPVLANLAVSLTFLKKESDKRRDDYHTLGAVKHDQVQTIYGPKFPDRRKNWNQECYDLAAGDIVPLKDVPEEFRSEKAVLRAVETTPDAILAIEDREKWLNGFGDKLPEGRRITLLAGGLARVKEGWRDYTKRPNERTTVKGSKGSYVMTKLAPRGETLMIFNDEGECVNAVSAGMKKDRPGYYDHSETMWAMGGGHGGNAINAFAPYRLLIADALGKNKSFYNALRGNDQFERINLYAEGSYGDRSLLPIEKWERTSIAGTDLTYVAPKGAGGRYGSGGIYFIFDGDKGMMGALKLETSGRGAALEYANLHTSSKMSRLLELSNGFAIFFDQQSLVSGQNPTFKESALYTHLGVRGPGRAIWYSLLERKVLDHGDLSVWTSAAGGSPRVSVAHSRHGILTEAKRLKNGDFTITYLNDEARKLQKEINSAYEAVKSKI